MAGRAGGYRSGMSQLRPQGSSHERERSDDRTGGSVGTEPVPVDRGGTHPLSRRSQRRPGGRRRALCRRRRRRGRGPLSPRARRRGARHSAALCDAARPARSPTVLARSDLRGARRLCPVAAESATSLGFVGEGCVVHRERHRGRSGLDGPPLRGPAPRARQTAVTSPSNQWTASTSSPSAASSRSRRPTGSASIETLAFLGRPTLGVWGAPRQADNYVATSPPRTWPNSASVWPTRSTRRRKSRWARSVRTSWPRLLFSQTTPGSYVATTGCLSFVAEDVAGSSLTALVAELTSDEDPAALALDAQGFENQVAESQGSRLIVLSPQPSFNELDVMIDAASSRTL